MPTAYLFLALYGLVLLATPILTIALYLRYAKLRKQLNETIEENARNLTQLQRAVGELQNKLATGSLPSVPPPEKSVAPEVRQQVPVPRSFPVVPIPPAPVVPPLQQTPAAPPRVGPQPPSQPPATPTIPVVEKKPEPAPINAPKPTVPVTQVPPVQTTPAPPAAPPKISPPSQ